MTKKKKSAPARAARRGPRITRVYTRTGDAGTTRLVGGQVVKKSDPRIESYGTVDELSVCMGHAREALREAIEARPPRERVGLALLAEHLRYLQNLLFTLGGELATRIEDRWEGMPITRKKDVTYLERLIDAYNDSLPPLKDFILPSGGPVALALHTCRVVCRRAERVIQTLADREAIGASALPFINRLSDLFFVLARWMAAQHSASSPESTEAIWDRSLEPPAIPKTPRIPKS